MIYRGDAQENMHFNCLKKQKKISFVKSGDRLTLKKWEPDPVSPKITSLDARHETLRLELLRETR